MKRYIKKFNWSDQAQTALNENTLFNPYLALYKEEDIVDFNGMKKEYKFGDFMITSGPLYYGENGWEIKDNWKYDSFNSVYGKNVGSYYFNFIEMGQLFTSNENFSESSGNINGYYNNMWKLPSAEDWETIIGTSRDGSTVNGLENKHYAFIRLTNTLYEGETTIFGLLLFPDYEVINGTSLSTIDAMNFTALTETQLDEYINQGCVFLPYSGRYGGSWYAGGMNGSYLSSTQSNSTSAKVLILSNNASTNAVNLSKTAAYTQIRLVRWVGPVE